MSATRAGDGAETIACGQDSGGGCKSERRIDLAALVCLIAWTTLAVLSHSYARVPITLFGAIMAVAWGATIAAWRQAAAVPRRALILRIWIGAIAFRLVGVAAVPIFEDDFYRFLWDGWVFATTGNPYGVAPADYFGRTDVPDAMLAVLDGINHPDVPTIYGPVAQWGFRLSHALAPGALWPWKLLLLAAELVTVRLMLLVAPAPGVVLFAWCPLLIQETAFNAHPEALGVVFLVAALVCLDRGRLTLAAAAFGLAAGVKPIGGLLAPLALLGMSRRTWLSLAATTLVLWAPFLTHGTAPWTGLATFARDWEFNSSVFGVVSALIGPNGARVACGLLMMIGYALLLVRATRRASAPHEPMGWRRDGLWVYGGLFVLSPVVNPWYLAWLLPFVAAAPSAVGIAALAAVSTAYLHGMNLGDEALGLYGHPVWLRPLEYGLPLLVAMAGVIGRIGRSLPGARDVTRCP